MHFSKKYFSLFVVYGILYILYLYIKYDYYIYLHGWESSTSRKWLNYNSKLTIIMEILLLYKVYTYQAGKLVCVAGIYLQGETVRFANNYILFVITSLCATRALMWLQLLFVKPQWYHKTTDHYKLIHWNSSYVTTKQQLKFWKDMTSCTI